MLVMMLLPAFCCCPQLFLGFFECKPEVGLMFLNPLMDLACNWVFDPTQ